MISNKMRYNDECKNECNEMIVMKNDKLIK